MHGRSMGGLWEVLSQDLPSRGTFIQRRFQRLREVLTFFCSVCFFVFPVGHFCIFMHFVSFVSLVNNCLGLSLGQTRTFVRGNSHFPACKPPVLCLLHISAYIYIFTLTSSFLHLNKTPIPLSYKPSCWEYQAFWMPTWNHLNAIQKPSCFLREAGISK